MWAGLGAWAYMQIARAPMPVVMMAMMKLNGRFLVMEVQFHLESLESRVDT